MFFCGEPQKKHLSFILGPLRQAKAAFLSSLLVDRDYMYVLHGCFFPLLEVNHPSLEIGGGRTQSHSLHYTMNESDEGGDAHWWVWSFITTKPQNDGCIIIT